jgi:hypothetical protein
MSRKFGLVDSGIWRSRKLKGASDQTKLLCVYLISCPHGNSVGLFHIPLAYIQADLGWTEEQVRIHVSELVSRHILEFDFEYDLLRFVGWWQHNPIDNGKHASAVARQMAELKCDSDVFRNHASGLARYAAESGKPYLNVLRASPDTGIDTGTDTGSHIQTLILTPIQTPESAAPAPTAPSGPADLKSLVFSRGVAMLKAVGSDEEQARSFFGKLIGRTSVGDVLEAIGKAEREAPADPKAFICGVLKPKARPRQAPEPDRHTTAIAKHNEAQRLKAAEDQVRAEGLHPMTSEGRARLVELMREAA